MKPRHTELFISRMALSYRPSLTASTAKRVIAALTVTLRPVDTTIRAATRKSARNAAGN